MADASDEHVVSVPSQPPAPYDAADDGAAGPWMKVSANLDGGSEAQWAADFPDGPGPWRQT